MPELNPNRRLEVDSVLKCDAHGAVYRLFLRQHQEPDGTLRAASETEIWPHPNHPGAPPPLHTTTITCYLCGSELKRVAP